MSPPPTAEQGTEVPDSVAVVIRTRHDPRRPYLSTAEAARRLGITRQAVVQQIHRGSLEGYGIANESRTRWFVPLDVVQAKERAKDSQLGEDELRKQFRLVQDALATMREAAEKRRAADALLQESRELSRQSQDRAEEAWAAALDVARIFEDFIARMTVPHNAEDI